MDDAVGDVCSICLEDLSCRPAGTKGRGKVKTYTIKACQHTYHKACIDEWYAFESKRSKVCACPLCRTEDTKHASYRRAMREREALAKAKRVSTRGPGLFARLLRATTRRGQSTQQRPPHALPSAAGNRARSNTQPARAQPAAAEASRPRANTSGGAPASTTRIVATNPNVPGSMYIFNGSIRQTQTGGSVFILDSAFHNQPPPQELVVVGGPQLRRRATAHLPQQHAGQQGARMVAAH